MAVIEEAGPIDFMLIEFHGKEINGELVPPLLDLVDRGVIRVLDVLIVVKRADGSFESLTTQDLDTNQVGDLGELAGASSGLFNDEDAASVAAALENDTAGLLIMYENSWAAPFAVAARKAGGQVVAGGRIPTQSLISLLDELPA
jgi:hypothetical protein